MKIAVTYDNGQIFQHFGHTKQFKLYTAENGKILSEEIIDSSGSGHGALAGLLSSLGADALICGGIGGGAQAALKEAGIRIYGGVQGDADKAAGPALRPEPSNMTPMLNAGTTAGTVNTAAADMKTVTAAADTAANIAARATAAITAEIL